MGLYDSVKVDYELPPFDGIVPEKGTIFQTKDLESLFLSYTITEEGFFVTPRYDDPPMHGYISIYTSINGVWVEYRIKFTDGLLAIVAPWYQERK